MKDDIKKLFPKEFYINKNEEMVAEITLENLNKIADCIINLYQENIKLIDENETIKNIKYTIDEVIYKSRNEKALKIIEKYKEDEGLTMDHDTWQHLYPVYFALKGDDRNER